MGADPLIGKVLHDTHEVVRLIGKGGMGTVYEAVHTRLRQKRFAVKVLHARMMEDERIFTRFQREAEIATKVGHPNIVDVLDFYETDDGQPCMVMEYLEGRDLEARIKKQGRLPLEQVIPIVEQVGSALQAVHDLGVMHRDMKPANIFLRDSPDGSVQVKVLDFGISKIKDSTTKLTGDHSLLGTPHYMSPEQAEGLVKEVDHHTDIFAVGTICYQMLCGVLPFDGTTMMGVIRAICDRPHPPITQHLPDIGEEVNRILNCALAKKKEDRYQRVEDFARDLVAALSREDDLCPGADVEGDVLDKTALETGDTVNQTSAHEATLLQPGIPQFTQPGPSGGSGGLINTTLNRSVGERLGGSRSGGSPRRSILLVMAVGALVSLFAAGGIFLALRSPDPPPLKSVSRAPDQALSVAVATPDSSPVADLQGLPGPASSAIPTTRGEQQEAAAKAASVRITLRLTPPNALVYLDGQLQQQNPLVLKRSPKERRLRVTAPGHVPAERTVRADTDQTLQFVLTAAPRAKVKAKPKRKPKPKPKIQPQPKPAFDDF